MSASRRNRLFDIEIDEVSSVDRPASQRGLIEIAKALQEADVADDDTEGQLTFDIPEGVEHGDTIVTQDGREFTFLETDEEGHALPLDGVDVDELVASSDEVYDLSDTDEFDLSDAGEGYEVGKALPVGFGEKTFTGAFGAARKLGAAGKDLPTAKVPARQVSKVPNLNVGQQAGAKAGHLVGRGEGVIRRNPVKAAAIAGGAGVAGGGAYMVAQKSLGTTVLEELSKAVTDEERNRIVAKMADDQERLAGENEELRKAFEASEDARLTEAFIAKAAEYELPVDPETFGPILKAIVEVLDEDQIEVLDTVLSSRGVPLDELGYAGGASNSGVLDEVSGLAAELVGKAAGQVTTEQATTALFEHNPDAYDAYLREQEGR